jgi:uncharacterized protein (DUF58 family)
MHWIPAFAGMTRRWRESARRPVHPESANAPILSAKEISELAGQAAHLARTASRREVHDHHAGDWPSAWLGRGLDFEEARPYVAGDDLRDMDWRTTARLGHPFVKIYREERQPVLHLVLDRGPTLRFGTRRRLKVAQAARVAALAAFAAAERNIAVGATLWDSTTPRRDLDLPPRHSRPGMLQLIGAFAAPCPPQPAEAAEGLHDGDRLHRLAAELPRGTRLLLVSDFAWLNASHAATLAHLAERTDLFAIRISDPAEIELPDVGLARFLDLADGKARWLDTGSAAARASHAAAFAARRSETDALFVRAGVRCLDLGSEVDDLISALHGHA